MGEFISPIFLFDFLKKIYYNIYINKKGKRENIMTRLRYFRETYRPSVILDVYECKEFSEIVIKEGGDVLTFRVYGNERDGFKVYER